MAFTVQLQQDLKLLVNDMQIALHIQLRFSSLRQPSLELVVRECRTDPFRKELVYLLRSTPYETLRLQQIVKMILDGVEVRVRLDTINQVVLQPELLDLVGCFVRQHLRVKLSQYLVRSQSG